ncbi:MAG: glycosyltransferase [bacterium]|nr:glycosyltransferase [bacterium]
MADSPLISVIVPVYNVEPYLRRCLDSICGQTYRNLEILCVNDGSTDGSATILEEFAAKDPRIKVITQANGGLAAARNTGLEHARGIWVTGVDSDDYLEPDAYAYALSAVAENVDIVCFGTNIIWDGVEYNDTYARSFACSTTGVYTPTPKLIAQTHVVFWNKLWRRSLVEQYQCRFPVGLWFEDFFFWRALAPFARNIAYLPDPKINYVRRPASIMCNTGTENIKTLDHIHVIDSLLKYFKLHPLPYLNGELDTFLFSLQCAECDVPPSLHHKLYSGYLEVAKRNGLYSKHSSALHFLEPFPVWKKIFVKHRFRKSTYGFFGLKIVSVNYKYTEKIRRIFGIRF